MERTKNRTMDNFEELWADIRKHAEAYDMEELLSACSVYLKADAAREDHPGVVMLLESAAESCRSASFEYYASTK